ncbi:LuxR C-terminal-related transcriptional regulator [Isoptericola halotolerans]|uniref:ATP/maltotriose-dependent transcriptional regulator MalT n=1 Tax=Isoptericola halotolerans TaxID=300560 RepID=A0ABX2A0X5_9MICO|nr:LuxR family transcriptional regulator [Isoptericola halotolerans]NOV95540.1 ATP/maltotriose-dependent transcriptional regulator MalT [Isoptericola halotolerans]
MDPVGARSALRAGRWREAATGFAALTAGDATAEDHEGLAQAAWWLDDAELALSAREAAYRSYRTSGDVRGAARAAAALAHDSVLFGAGVAVGRGWLARATDLLGGRTDVPEAGWLAVRRAELALALDHDPDAALDAATTAQQIGTRTADGDLVVVAQALAGLARVGRGEVTAGMELLDAASAAATAGDVEDLMWMGKVCCWLITACQEAHDLDRAREWCVRVAEICERRDLEPLFLVCRTRYASVLLAQGEISEAEASLTRVLDRLEHSRRETRDEAVRLLGELRRRQGRLAEAEMLLQQASSYPGAMTGLAQVRLAAGDADGAWSIISELLRAPGHPWEKVDVLAVAVAAGIAAGHHDEAREAAARLRALAATVGTDFLRGTSAAAEARLCEPVEALPHQQAAVRHLHDARLPLDEAECRLDLAETLLALGDTSAARRHAAAALTTLETLQSGPALDRARAILGARSDPLTPRQSEVLRLLARGLTNAEIAVALQLSEHTVHRHVANIYLTLGLRSRAAAATYAAGRGLR